MQETMSHNPVRQGDQHAVRQFIQIRSELIHEPASKAIHAAIFLPQKHGKKQIRDESATGGGQSAAVLMPFHGKDPRLFAKSRELTDGGIQNHCAYLEQTAHGTWGQLRALGYRCQGRGTGDFERA